MRVGGRQRAVIGSYMVKRESVPEEMGERGETKAGRRRESERGTGARVR